MTEQAVFLMIKSVGFPATYHHFEEGQSPEPPFLAYLYPDTNHFSADGIVYQGINKLRIELYTNEKDLDAERKLEAVLKKYGFFYQKPEEYLETEKMYEVIYEMEVVIDGE